jgi:hypothetical protein
MKYFFTTILLICSAAFASAGEPNLEPIFNGNDLTGWAFENADKWSVTDGVLTATNDGGAGDILLTEKSDYRNFIVQVDFKFVDGRIDSGLFLRDTKEQIQIGESGSLKRDMTAQPYIPGKGYPVQVDKVQQLLKTDDWNTLKIKVTGSSYTTWLNGEEILTYESKTIAPEGTIGIQVHPKRDMTILYRNILAAELPD